jgi:hypothetical protein
MDDWKRIKLAVQEKGVSRSQIYVLDRKFGGVLKKVEGMTFCNTGRIQQIVAEAPEKTDA